MSSYENCALSCSEVSALDISNITNSIISNAIGSDGTGTRAATGLLFIVHNLCLKQIVNLCICKSVYPTTWNMQEFLAT